MGRDGDGQDARRRSPGDERCPGRRRRPPQARLAVRAGRAARSASRTRSQRLVLAPVHDELGRAAKELDELGVQVALRAGRRRPAARAEPPGDRRHADPADEQSRGEDRRGDRQDRGSDADRDRAGRDGDERRGEAAQVEALERVDVADHPADEIAPPVGLEPAGASGSMRS